MMDRLFVYGTLAPGRPNEHVLAEVAGTWAPATVRGTLVQAGWGAEAGYPAIVPAADGAEVHGFVFSSEDLPAHWDRLDAFEGAGYVRVPIPARLADGSVVEACIYALADPPADAADGC